MNIRYIGSSSEVLIFWLLRLTPQCLSLHQQTINTPMKWAVYFMPSPLRWRKWFAIDTETQKNYVIGLIYKIKPCIYEYMRRFWVERKYSYRALHMHEKLTKCDAIYDRNFPRHDFFKALFLALSFSTSPSLIGRPITGIAQKFLSQLEQFLKTSISLKKNRRRKAKNYRDIAGGGKEGKAVFYFQSNCGYGLHGSLLISRESDRSIRGEFIYFYNSSYLNNSRSI